MLTKPIPIYVRCKPIMLNSSRSPTSLLTYSLHADPEEPDLLDIPVLRSPKGMSVLDKILAGKYDFMAPHRKTPEHEQLSGNVSRPEMAR